MTQNSSAPRPRQLVDSFGRVARDLRVSLTDRCNLRWTYCLPADGLVGLPTEHSLSDAEVIRLVRIGVERWASGRCASPVASRCCASPWRSWWRPPPSCAPTRGTCRASPSRRMRWSLDKRAAGLAAAGLNRINISLDTTDPQTFAALSRRDRHEDVLRGIDAALATG